MHGTDGERLAQDLYGSGDRAERFYRDQLVETLTPRMAEFVGEQGRFTIASADADGRPDLSVRFGEPGFVRVLDERTLCWPELRGNGVMTTLGNIAKNPAVHLMFLDAGERIGLHVRGDARVVSVDEMHDRHPDVADTPFTGRPPERWVIVALESGYIHCRKHFPRTDAPVEWGTDDVKAKGGDYFGAKSANARKRKKAKK